MKKIAILLLIVCNLNKLQAQDNLAGGRLGFTTYIANGGAVAFGPGFFYQRSVSDNVAVGVNFDFHFGSATVINLEPRIDYFPSSTFEGFHIGSKVSFNAYSGGGGNGLNLGVNFGYMFEVANNLKLDFSVAPGAIIGLGAGSSAGFSLIPVAGIGYAF